MILFHRQRYVAHFCTECIQTNSVLPRVARLSLGSHKQQATEKITVDTIVQFHDAGI